jgi:FkbM family methyltransferase
MPRTAPANAYRAPGFGLLWSIARPIRCYVRHSPVPRGKGFLIRRVLLPILPPEPALFLAQIPGGGQVHLHPRESLGFVTLIYGGFETAEVSCAIELASRGKAAFDVGANVGIYSVALGSAVGNTARVVAVEPDKNNVRRLRANLALNSIANVDVVEAAAGDRDDEVGLRVADDRAYNSIMEIERGQPTGEMTMVRSVRLDRIWHDLGRPDVSFVKVDVEGAELSVLRGAQSMVATTHPALLLEANTDAALASLRRELEPLGYRRSPRASFEPWNHLFTWSGAR